MTTRVQSLLAALDGREGHIKPSIPSFHMNSPPPFLFHHPFAYFTTILHTVARKTHFVQKLLLKLFDGVFYRAGSYGRLCYTERTLHDNAIRTLSSSLSNLLAGRMAQLFSETLGVSWTTSPAIHSKPSGRPLCRPRGLNLNNWRRYSTCIRPPYRQHSHVQL